MPALVARGDRIIRTDGTESWMSRPSMPFSSWYGGGIVRLSGDTRTVSYGQLYEQQPWVFVCVNKLARQIATLPLKVYRTGSQNQRERVTDGRLVDLLKEPWPRARAVHLKQKIAFPALLHGNGLLRKVREDGIGGPPTRFQPLDWRYLTPRTEAGELLFWQTTQFGDDVRVAPEETLYFQWEGPDGVSGTSPLSAVGVTLNLEDSAQRIQQASFGNGNRPSIGITLHQDAEYNEEVRDLIRDSVQSLHGGVDNAGKVAVVGGGATLETLSHTAVEAELIEQRKLDREEVAAAYDIPPPMIGILDKATYSNINEQHRMLYMTVLRPWLTLVEETIEAHLIAGEPEFEGLTLEFDLAEVLKGDAKERGLAYKTFLEAGTYTVNELRKLENQPEFDHPLANTPLIPANNLSPIDAEPPAPVPAPQEEPPADVVPVLASHLQRATARIASRNGAGHDDPFDAARFVRELREDLEPKLGYAAQPFAETWGQAIDAGVKDAAGDQAKVESFLASLT